MLSVFVSNALQSQNLKLGDYVAIDDVPSLVFYIDESGKHGLAMSLSAIPAREEKEKEKFDKQVDKYLEEGWISASMAEKYKNGTLSCGGGLAGFSRWNIVGGSKYVTYNLAIPDDLMEKLNDSGKDNQDAIVNYCKDKNISLAEKFPYQEWALQLGQGWYIPGSKELELFAKFYFGGVGEEFKQSMIRDRSKQVSNDKRIQKALFANITWLGIISSSVRNKEHGFRVLSRRQKTGIKGGQWFEFMREVNAFSCCAVHEF